MKRTPFLLNSFEIVLPIFLFLIAAGCVSSSKLITTPETILAPVELLAVADTYTVETRTFDVRLSDSRTVSIVLPADLKTTASDLSEIAPEQVPFGSLIRATARPDRKIKNRFTAESFMVANVGNIAVLAPSRDAAVFSPIAVNGFARVFENAFAYRLKDTNDNVIAKGSVTSQASDVGFYGPFQFEIPVPKVDQTKLTLEVFVASAKDGSDRDLVSIPLELLSANPSSVTMYFPNASFDPSKTCSLVFPTTHQVAQTSSAARSAIYEMLNGPTSEEKKKGFSSAIVKGTRLLGFTVQDKTATVNFSSELNAIPDACRRAAARAQIEQTVKLDQTIEEVVIEADGVSEGVLAP